VPEADNITRIRRQGWVRCAVAVDTLPAIAGRITNLLSHGRRITLTERAVENPAAETEVKVGLTLCPGDGNLTLITTPTGLHFGVSLMPAGGGIATGFGLGAYRTDGNDTEANVWDRIHRHGSGSFNRTNIVTVEFHGGTDPNSYGREDRIVIHRWNSHGYHTERVVAFDPGPSEQQRADERAALVLQLAGHDWTAAELTELAAYISGEWATIPEAITRVTGRKV
jgi:hypothetical protein